MEDGLALATFPLTLLLTLTCLASRARRRLPISLQVLDVHTLKQKEARMSGLHVGRQQPQCSTPTSLDLSVSLHSLLASGYKDVFCVV